MTESAAHTSESSLLLWMLAAAVGMLATYVALGWVREAQRRPALRESWRAVLLSAASMGTGICCAMVLALSAEALVFPLGYPLGRVFLLWGAAMLGCMPACFLLVRSQRVLAILGAGALLAALAAGVQMGWVWAVGFRPGVIWRMEFVAVAGVFLLMGFAAATWISFSAAAREGRRRQLWRLGGAALLGLSLMAGQEILMAGAGLLAQVGSVYQREVPAALLCLAGGVVVPLVLSVMALDLELRRRARRRGGRDGNSTLQLQKRRKQRHHERRL
jgi:NO-binding membrane sensor protein with MHYT domain